MTRLRHAVLLLAFVACALGFQAAVDVRSLPKPTSHVSDLAHVLNADDKAKLEAYCDRMQQELGVQLAIVTIDTIGDTPIENFTLDLFRTWGIGSKRDNSGILLLTVIKDRKDRVEVGRGLEQYATDGFDGSTLRAMRPELRANNYGAALIEGARSIGAKIALGKGVTFDENAGLPAPRVINDAPQGSSGGFPLGQIIVGIVAVLFILSLFSRGGRGGGGGFWTGFLLSTLLNSGGGGRGGGNWGGGGFGGDSGGGGFGGFGGGDSGGGGASSDW